LLVSGGHTFLVELEAPGRYRLLGQTIDDAAGEAFDKVARYLGLGYPGGPVIDAISAEGDPTAFAFPRALPGATYDFSFSGLKTSVVRTVERHPEAATADVAASFQEAVVDVLVAKTMRAAEHVGATGVCLAGGVAANSLLRSRISEAAASAGIAAYLPSRAMCTDNAAMVAARAGGGWRTMDRARSRSGRPQPVLGPHRLIDSPRPGSGVADGGRPTMRLCRFRALIPTTPASSPAPRRALGSSWPPSSPRAGSV